MTETNERARWLAASVGVRAIDDVILRVRGEDARSWVAGQVTNDTTRLAPGDSVYALVLDARGKILSDVWVVESEPLRLVVPSESEATLLEHFDKYIVMEDVELERSEEAIITVQGPKAAEAVEQAALTGVRCPRLGTDGRDVIVPAEKRNETLRELIRSAQALGGGEVDDEAWELARLRAVRPRFGVDFGPSNYPQEAGLKQIAVSFQKGCYIGQEVVCTLENRGQLSRHLVELESEAELKAGLELRHGEKPVGQVTSAMRDPETGKMLALGYVRRIAASPGTTLSTELGACQVGERVAPAPGHGDGRAL